MPPRPEPSFSYRSVVLSAFLPTLLFSIGEGAIIPLIPVAADDLGASLAVAGLIAGMIMIGELAGDIPSGWLVSRIGERNAMLWASAASVAGLVVCLVSPGWPGLAVGVFLIGVATAVFSLARHAFMTTFVPPTHRARALSTLAGLFRAGWFVGPFLAAGAVHLTGTAQSAFWIHLVCCVLAAAVLLLFADPSQMLRTGAEGDEVARSRRLPENGLVATLVRNRGVLLRMGTGAALIGALRSSRAVILPLWAVSIGMAETQTALIIGTAGAIDFALFYASGQIMDRFGRAATAIPSMLGLGAGHLLLSVTHDVQGAVVWFAAVAGLMALANGLGSGILMTLGADLAPPGDPAPFLGAFRFTGDTGNAAAPLAVAGLTAVASLPLAAAAMGALGLVGAGALHRWIPRYVPRPGRP